MNLTLKQLHARLTRNAFKETDPARREAMLALQTLIMTQFAGVKGRIDFNEPMETEEIDDPMDDFNYVGSRHHY